MTEDDVDVHEMAPSGRSLVLPEISVARVWPDPSQSPPVFLHSSFRSGSTWLWQKLRAAPTTLAYYEVFHENLECMTATMARDITSTSWDSGHPVASPYFLEYLPLLEPEGGIAGFDPGTSFVNFIPAGGADGDLHPAEKIYVERLISTAWSQRRIPVLSCTRSLGRARALRRAVGGQKIFLHRNLFHQWASYCGQAERGNRYFLETIRLTALSAAHDPFLCSVADWFDLRQPDPAQEKLFQAFLILHLYCYSIAFDAADLVVELSALVSDSHVRRHVEIEISDMIRHKIDLSDARENFDFTSLVIENPVEMRDTIEQFVKLIPAASMSPDAHAFMQNAKDRALAEWERFEFFNRGSRTFLTRKIDDAQVRLEEQIADNLGLQADLDRLTTQSLDASRTHAAEIADHLAAIRRSSCERDALLRGLSASQAARDDLGRTVADLSAERDAVVVEAAEAAARSKALLKEFTDIGTLGDDLRRSLSEAQAELEATLQERPLRASGE